MNAADATHARANALEEAACEGAGAPAARDVAGAARDQVVRASIVLMHCNVQTLERALQSGARLAARVTELSTDQVGRAFGICGESGEDATQKSSQNLEAIVQSSAVLAQVSQRLCEDWADLARARVDRGFGRLDAFLHCRTPQDFTALQSELLRDNLETLLSYTRKAGEESARLAGSPR